MGLHFFSCDTCSYWTTILCPRKGVTYLKDADMVLEIVGCASHSKIERIILRGEKCESNNCP